MRNVRLQSRDADGICVLTEQPQRPPRVTLPTFTGVGPIGDVTRTVSLQPQFASPDEALARCFPYGERAGRAIDRPLLGPAGMGRLDIGGR